MKMNKKEWMIFACLVGGFFLIGLSAGIGAGLSFAGIGLIVWAIWRGRHL